MHKYNSSFTTSLLTYSQINLLLFSQAHYCRLLLSIELTTNFNDQKTTKQ